MSSTLSRARVGGLAVVLMSMGALSGCGVSQDAISVGAAAQVGETKISYAEVDEPVDDVCTYFSDSGQAGFPRSIARQQFLSVLVERAAARQVLDEAGLALSDDYQDNLVAVDNGLAQVPEAQRPAFRILGEANEFVANSAYVIGEAAFAESGETPGSPTVVADRGMAQIGQWLEDNDVQLNPMFGLALVDGALVNDATGLSVAQSDLATLTAIDPSTATQESVDAAASQLPSDQLCGAAAGIG